MLRRSPALLVLAVALALPAGAAARIQHIGTISSGDSAPSPKAALHKAEAIVAGRDGRHPAELTPLLKEVAVALPALEGADRTRAKRLLARPTQGEAASNEAAYTVPEHNPPLCSAHFCIHWVDTTDDAPPSTDSNGNGIPDYVETMDGVFEHVYDVENGQLGWRDPTPDGARGCPASAGFCMNKTDVYVKNVGDQGIYGYSAPDPLQKSLSQYAYLVMDNDYAEPTFTQRYHGDFLQPMEVTAAHEYNHVLQFGYDVAQDTWMFEATAVWMEDKVYTDVNDYLQYLTPWSQMSLRVPLTRFNSQRQDDRDNVKVYGDMVWNRWIDTKLGNDAIRNAWEHSLTSKPKSFAPGAYDQALRERGSSFFSAFTRFAADTVEWRASDSAFPEGSTFPDMQRVPDPNTGGPIQLVANRGGVSGTLDHTTYGLLDVPVTSRPRIKLVVNTPRGPQMALALIGRRGGDTSGTATVAIRRLARGGVGTVTLNDPRSFSRITAAIINGDGRTTGRFSRTLQDWEWVSDGVPMIARLSTDFTPPRVRHRSPASNQRGVSRRANVKAVFSERMLNVGTATVKLIGPGNHRVRGRVKLTRGRKLEIFPRGNLRSHARYHVRLSNQIVDLGGNPLRVSARGWSFSTGR